MKIALILMIKDEVDLLVAWLDYHAHIFGPESIYIFDNGSSNKKTLDILACWSSKLGGLDFSYSSTADYENKPHIYLAKIRELEKIGFQCFFPLDCDEFIAVDTATGVVTNPLTILEEISQYKDSKNILRIKYALDNSPLVDFGYVKSLQKKCFFFANVCRSSDHGFHDSLSYEFGLTPITTSIVYIHYHFRTYTDYIRSAKDKLAPWIENFEKTTLINYKICKKPGHHLVDKILSDPANYYREQLTRFANAPVIQVSCFQEFMYPRNLLVNSELTKQLVASLTCEEGWHAHVDLCTKKDEFFKIQGWAFNKNGRSLATIRLRFDEFITEPVDFVLSLRPDVTRVIPNAPPLCGFSLSYTNTDLQKINSIGMFISSHPSIMGEYYSAKLI